jgi:hypothetical protein
MKMEHSEIVRRVLHLLPLSRRPASRADDAPVRVELHREDTHRGGRAPKLKLAARKATRFERRDDDTEGELYGDSIEARARRRERSRCAAIFGCEAASQNRVLAANLAFLTPMRRVEAIALLEQTPPARVPGISAEASAARMARNPRVSADAGASPTPEVVIASGWDRAFAKVSPRAQERRAVGLIV